MRKEHVSTFPRRLVVPEDYDPAKHTLAIWDDRARCVCLLGSQVTIPYETSDQFILALTALGAHVLCNEISNLPFLTALLKDKRCEAFAIPEKGIRYLHLRSKRSACFVPRNAWFPRSHASVSLADLNILAAEFELTGIWGATPSSMAEHIMACTVRRKVSRPSHAVRRFFEDISGGNRAETFELSEEILEIYGADRNSAFHDSATRTMDPRYAPVYFAGECGLDCYPVYFARIRFRIPLGVHLPHGILGVRDEKTDTTYWPVTRGQWFETKAFNEAIAFAREKGVEVEIVEGYAWEAMSDWLKPYADYMVALKSFAKEVPLSREEVKRYGKTIISDIIKQAGVGAYGRMLMDNVTWTMIPIDEAQAGDEEIFQPYADISRGESLWNEEYALHRSLDPECNKLIHVGMYIILHNQLELTKRMYAEEEAGNHVLATNYDAYITERQSLLPTGTQPGEWKTYPIRHPHFTAHRSLMGLLPGGSILDRRPGTPRDKWTKERLEWYTEHIVIRGLVLSCNMAQARSLSHELSVTNLISGEITTFKTRSAFNDWYDRQCTADTG